MTKTVGKQWIFPVFRRLYVEMRSSADKKMSPGKDVKCLWCIFFCACEKCGKCVWSALYTNSEQTWKSYRLFSFAILILAEQSLYYNENRSFLFVLIWHIVTVHSVLERRILLLFADTFLCSFHHISQFLVFSCDISIVFSLMRKHTVCAVFNSLFRIPEIPTAFLTQSI